MSWSMGVDTAARPRRCRAYSPRARATFTCVLATTQSARPHSAPPRLGHYCVVVVSISEKTLEHWAGIDLHGRVPSARQWWPTRGEDAAVGLVPTAAHSQPGLPSSCWNSRQQIPSGQRHGVKIDLGQLSTYLSRRGPSGQRLPVYYVFPVPHWTGSPRSTYVSPMPGSVTASGTAPAEWLDLAAGDPCWFGHWLYVMPAADVARALPRGWLWRLSRDHGRRFENLFCIPPEPDQFGNRLAWSDPQVFARQPLYYPVLWPEFWRRMVAGRTHYARPWRITAAGLLDPTPDCTRRRVMCTPPPSTASGSSTAPTSAPTTGASSSAQTTK